jgi:hypothetical protein
MAVVDGQDAETALLGAVSADRTTPALCGESSVVLLLGDPVLPHPQVSTEALLAVAGVGTVLRCAGIPAPRTTLAVRVWAVLLAFLDPHGSPTCAAVGRMRAVSLWFLASAARGRRCSRAVLLPVSALHLPPAGPTVRGVCCVLGASDLLAADTCFGWSLHLVGLFCSGVPSVSETDRPNTKPQVRTLARLAPCRTPAAHCYCSGRTCKRNNHRRLIGHRVIRRVAAPRG